MANELAPIAISDDGDLEDVRRILERLDLPFADAWRDDPPPNALRISNPRHALEIVEASPPDVKAASFHIVILGEDEGSMRGALKTGHFDFVVQRPVHPTALRLLILHALYSGPERRSLPRVAMSAEVKVGSGLLPRAAVLTQLSEKGCGVICSRELAEADRTTVVFPSSLTCSGKLAIEGRVVASVRLADDTGESYEISIAFRPPKAQVREQLRSLMAHHGVGSAALRPRKPAPVPPDEGAGGEPGERRRSGRASYCRPVMASADGAVHTLSGRDLSTGGMRVAPDARLKTGESLKLVIYGQGGRTPLVVKAVVGRDDGPKGFVLQFRDIGPTVTATLEEMIAELPRFGGKEGGPNTVVSEVLEDA